MNRLLNITVAACLLLAGLAATTSPARADWRSLSGLLPAGANVVDVRISPDSKLVAYVADADTPGMFELYVVPIAGGTPRKLNAPLPPEGDVAAKLEVGTAATTPSGATPGYAIQFTPDSNYVVYVADQELDKRNELYRVDVGGGTVRKLSGALADGGNVGSFLLHPNSQHIMYRADQDTDETYELYSIAGDFGPFKRNGALPMGGDVGTYAIDPHTNRVLYSADQDTNDTYELYSVPIVGGAAPLKLNPPLVLTGGGDKGLYDEFAVSPTAPIVVFNARQAGSTGGKLYRRGTGGGLLTPLGFNVPASQRLIHFRISPNGDRVVFNVGTHEGMSKATMGTLYSTPIGGGGVTELTEPADALFGVSAFHFTPNGERVVYKYRKNIASNGTLESSTVNGGVRALIFANADINGLMSTFTLSDNSKWVFVQQSNLDKHWLSAYPTAGGSGVSYGAGYDAAGTPDSSRAVFVRNAETGDSPGLFSMQINGADERELSGLQGSGEVKRFDITHNGKWIVFLVRFGNQVELRMSDGTAAQPPAEPPASPPPSPQPTAYRTLLPLAQR